MDARGSLEPDVVADDHRQVPDGHVLKPIEGVHRRGDLPHRLEIPGRLLLQGGSHPAKLRAGDLIGVGNESRFGDQHDALPPTASAN
jgi:hypothetical protein